MTAINHAAVVGAKVELTDYQADHVIADASIPVAKVSGLGTAATHASTDFDASGAAAAAQAAAIAASDTAGAAAAAQAASQPLNSGLTSIAALATTTFGRGLLTSADAPGLRTTAGLGTLATQSGTFSGTSSGTNTGDQVVLSQAQIFTRMLGA